MRIERTRSRGGGDASWYHDAAMMREVFHNDHYRVDFDAEARLIRMTRSAVPQSADLLDALVTELLQVVQPLRPARVLIDMRLAPGNNSPAFEQVAMRATGRLTAGFGEVAVLIQTAVGRLHFQRLGRGTRQPLHVFMDEAEALEFLRAQPLP